VLHVGNGITDSSIPQNIKSKVKSKINGKINGKINYPTSAKRGQKWGTNNLRSV